MMAGRRSQKLINGWGREARIYINRAGEEVLGATVTREKEGDDMKVTSLKPWKNQMGRLPGEITQVGRVESNLRRDPCSWNIPIPS